MAAPMKQCLWLKFLRQSIAVRCGAPNISRCRAINTSTFDPGPVFFREDVQQLLKRITGLNLDKVFKFRAFKDHTEPAYELLTQAELEKKDEETMVRAQAMLQMPPYLKINDNREDVISEDPEIAGHFQHNIIFTDITYGIPHKERSVVVREPGGKLRSATNEERKRIQQVYFPQEGRMIHTPKMFEEENLERMLNSQKYEYILDSACVQFEPDESDYIRITHRTYEHVNSTVRYDDLRYTRHFGPLSFYLAHYQKIEGLLVDMIQRNLVNDAADLVDLYHIIHTDAESVKHVKPEHGPLDRVQAYLEYTSRQPGMVELALQSYRESLKQVQSDNV